MRGRIKGTINCPQDGVSYNASVQIFNQRLISWPSVVVQPAEEDDVVFALNLAKQRGLAVTVKGGGHSPAGWALADGAMLIDMTLMRAVEVDTGESLARVQAGANWEDVMVELEAREAKQVYVGGQCPTVGVPGVSLGGGIGWMSRSHGLISDNVEYFRVALPGGQVVSASPQENAELYWGLAGCGHANFGVVTEVGLKLLPEQERYWGGMLCFQELDEASTMQLLEVYQQGVTRELDDRISFYGLVNRQVPLAEVDADNGNKPAEDGSNMHAQVCLTAFFDGPVQEAGAAARPLLGKLAQLLKSSQGLLQNSMMEGLRFSARMGGHKELERALDNDTGELEAGMKLLMDGSVFDQGHTWRSFAHLMGGRQMQVYWRSGMLQDIPEWYPQAISRQFFTPVPMLPQLVRQDLPFRNRYFFLQLELHHVGGVVSSHPRRKQSSYPHRDALFVASLLCFSPRWDLEADTPMMQRLRFRVTDSMHDTMTRFYNSLSPAFAGAYPNYNDREQTDWEEAYYGGSLPRLKALQQSLGAEQLFRTHQRLGNASLAKL